MFGKFLKSEGLKAKSFRFDFSISLKILKDLTDRIFKNIEKIERIQVLRVFEEFPSTGLKEKYLKNIKERYTPEENYKKPKHSEVLRSC